MDNVWLEILDDLADLIDGGEVMERREFAAHRRQPFKMQAAFLATRLEFAVSASRDYYSVPRILGGFGYGMHKKLRPAPIGGGNEEEDPVLGGRHNCR